MGKETGKMYVQCCLLLETKNRAPVTVQDMVKHFPMSRGALPSRTSWDQCYPASTTTSVKAGCAGSGKMSSLSILRTRDARFLCASSHACRRRSTSCASDIGRGLRIVFSVSSEGGWFNFASFQSAVELS